MTLHLIFLLEKACIKWNRFRSLMRGVRQCEEAILHKLFFFSLVASSSSSSEGSASRQFRDKSESESSKVTLSVDSSKLKCQAVDKRIQSHSMNLINEIWLFSAHFFKKMFLKFNPFSRNCWFLFLVLSNSKFSFAGCFPIQLISFLSNYQINKRNKKKQKNLVLESSVIYLLLLCWGRGISYEQHTYHAQSQHTPCSCQLLLWILACSSRTWKCCLVGSRSPG